MDRRDQVICHLHIKNILAHVSWPFATSLDHIVMRTRGNYVCCRSLWHGPDRDQKMQVQFLTPMPPGLLKSRPVAVLKGPDCATEIATCDMLRQVRQVQLGPTLCNRHQRETMRGIDPCHAGATACIATFTQPNATTIDRTTTRATDHNRRASRGWLTAQRTRAAGRGGAPIRPQRWSGTRSGPRRYMAATPGCEDS